MNEIAAAASSKEQSPPTSSLKEDCKKEQNTPLFDERPSLLKKGISLFSKHFRQLVLIFFGSSVVQSFLRFIDKFVESSGTIVRRLHRVVETGNYCLPNCPYFKHCTYCPLSHKANFTLVPGSEELILEDLDFIKSSVQIKKNEDEITKSESAEIQTCPPTPEETQELAISGKDPNFASLGNSLTHENILESVFYFVFTWFLLCPINAVVALLNFQRSLAHDFYDYFQLQSDYVTTVGRRVLSPRRVVRSKILTRSKTLINQIINLSAGNRLTPYKLSIDPNLCMLRVQPVHDSRKATLKRKLSLEDLYDSVISDNDEDYEPSTTASSSSSSECEEKASQIVSENDLSVHEEDGFLALKAEPDCPPEEPEKLMPPPTEVKPEPSEKEKSL